MEHELNQLERYYLIFTDILNNIEHKKYCYMSNESYMQLYVQDLFKGELCNCMQIYWKEMLLRAHFAAVTSIIRNHKWLSGVIYGIENKNLMVFASSLRGFLEAVTDSYYSLESVPTSLALNFTNINQAIKGELSRPLYCGELEDKLIHFQFAAKSNEKYQNAEKALTNSKYIELFDMYSDVKTKELYSLLCEITHPASKSISCFTSEVKVSDDCSYSITSTESDNKQILEIKDKYKGSINQLMRMSVSTSVISLKILNLYDFDGVKSDYINDCVVEKIIIKDNWNKILKMVEQGADYIE